MLTVQYPSSITVHYPSGFTHVRGFVIDENGFILSEVTVPREAPGYHKGIITAYLPGYMKRPRWDGARWLETYGWYRAAWRWIMARFTK